MTRKRVREPDFQDIARDGHNSRTDASRTMQVNPKFHPRWMDTYWDFHWCCYVSQSLAGQNVDVDRGNAHPQKADLLGGG
jgi:hypothetical protein